VTIFVDGAHWTWRGRRWAHLISDDSLDELHRFAHDIGKRRIGFQGDHYDVNEDDRELAIAKGAEVVTAREIVRSLRSAGLRRRPGAWSAPSVLVDDTLPGPVVGDRVRHALASLDGLSALAAAITRLPIDEIARVRTLVLHRDKGESALALAPVADVPMGLGELVDECWLGDQPEGSLLELIVHGRNVP
jgi:hypothetical protein